MGRFSGFSSAFAIGQGAAQALFGLLQMPAHCGLADAQGFACFLHGHALEKVQLHALPLPGGQLLPDGQPQQPEGGFRGRVVLGEAAALCQKKLGFFPGDALRLHGRISFQTDVLLSV